MTIRPWLMRYHITGIPALLFFKQGAVVDTVIGAVARSVLQKHIDSIVSHG